MKELINELAMKEHDQVMLEEKKDACARYNIEALISIIGWNKKE